MLIDQLMKDVAARGGVSKAFQLILAASLVTNVFMAGAFATMDRTVRTVLIPPEITKSFWVDGRHLSQEYLEEMGGWVVDQYASVTPANIDYKVGLILKHVHPSVFGDLSVRFKAGAQRLKGENISRSFMAREVRISEQTQAVAIIGYQESWISDKKLPGAGLKAYLVAFDYDGNKTTIKELRETNVQNPFAPPQAQAQAQPADLGQEYAPVPTADVPQQGALQQTSGAVTQSANLPPAPPAPSSPATQAALQAGMPVPSQPNVR